jgi:signal transduction histidine kinase
MAHETSAGSTTEALQIPYSRIATFVRQITHDVRNNLNSMDLQAAYVIELITDPEAVQEVKRIRQLVQTSAKQLQALSANFQTSSPNLVTYTAAILVEDLQDRLKKQFPETVDQIQWSVALGEDMVDVDVEMFFSAVVELFRNAFQFRAEGQSLTARAAVEEDGFVLEITEGKAAGAVATPENWGQEPFVSSRRSGYGLGLFRVRRTINLHGGDLNFSFDPTCSELRTRVWLPLATHT